MTARAPSLICMTALAYASVCELACGGTAKSGATTASTATVAHDAGLDGSAADPPPERVEPWPATKPGAVWTVVEWKMTEREASEALAQAGFTPKAHESASGEGETIDVASPVNGWKASIAFDAKTKQVVTITVRGDPATIAQAHAERAQLEERFGTPAETRVHWSKQCANDKAIEIEGPLPSWRVTQSLARQGDAKTAVDWPSLKDLTWGQPFAAIGPAMKSAGFVREKLPPPPAPPPSKKGTKPTKPAAPAKPAKPPPKTEKIVELTFKKGDEHVRLGILEKKGLQSVAVGRDVADRKDAEHRANEALGSLGSCLSEAETESSVFRDATVEVRLALTGFQGQRVVLATYRNLGSDAPP